MRLVILGGSGAGKGTQAQLLCNHLKTPWISTGEILRGAIAAQTELGRQAEPYFKKGDLVPDPTMIGFIRERLLLADAKNGWVLDGYPRTAFQAEELDFLLDDLKQRLNWAIWLDVSKSVLLSRSIARSRSDDRPAIVQRRIDLFHECTVPILEYYEHRDRLLTVNGAQPPERVHQEILDKLGTPG